MELCSVPWQILLRSPKDREEQFLAGKRPERPRPPDAPEGLWPKPPHTVLRDSPESVGTGRSRTCHPTHLRSVSHATLFSPCPRASSPTERNTNQSRCLLSRRDAVFPALSLCRWKHGNDNRLQGGGGWVSVCVGGQRGGDTGPPGAIATTQAVGRTKNPTGQSSTAVS